MTLISIAQIVAEIQDLPSLPAVVMELLNQIDDEQVDTQELAAKVSRDLALTAKTLRYANSAYYSTMVRVTTIQQAISLLGLSTVRHIMLNAALSGCFPEQRCNGFSHQQFWRHANLVAIVSQLLAQRVGFNQDVAFTAGLLHDIGTLVLVTYHTEDYQQVLAWQLEHQSTQLQAERQLLGIGHTEVGEVLAQQWNFSDAMRHAIAGHHKPDQAGLGFLPAIVHAANAITHSLAADSDEHPERAEMNELAWSSLNLDQAALDQIRAQAGAALAKLEQSIEL